MKRRILVVEDEQHIAEAVVLNLELAGYEVGHAPDGGTGYAMAAQGGPDLVILDVMLPEMDGLSVCERLRREGHRMPILFLTAKDRDEDKVRGLEAGGDDYVTKPFSIDELLARIRGMFRRQEWYARPVRGQDRYRFDDAEIDFRGYEATVRGEARKLTEKELMLMKLLVERAGEVVHRRTILDQVWGYEADTSSRSVDNLIVRLRKIFEKDPAHPRHIHTIYGAGYRFTPGTTEEAG
jgi:two-component system alkaline phosphatase synthesis response regulator PhoP